MVVDTPDDEPKSERFNMFISRSELTAIEEWGWRNRIRSKSEAVRRLIQIGMLFDENSDKVVKTAVELKEDFSARAVDNSEKLLDEDNVDEFILSTMRLYTDTVNKHADLIDALNLILQPAHAMKKNVKFEDAQSAFVAAKVDSVSRALQRSIERYETQKGDPHSSNESPEGSSE
ncbi:hypothetical protein N7I30_16675 [Aurantimonas litoralis]|nr:hypothetical protein [Aurantimonas litoralis]